MPDLIPVLRLFFVFQFFLPASLSLAQEAPEQESLALQPEVSHTLQTLLAPFQNIKTITLKYHEDRYSVFLKQPKRIHGQIEYMKPDHFIKTIEHPEQASIAQQRFIIHGDTLTIEQRDHKHQIESQKQLSLDDYPQFKQFKALFKGLLEGNAATLAQYYQYRIDSLPDGDTRLTLKPHIADAFIEPQQGVSRKIDVVFHQQHIKTISMTGFGSERSVLNIDEIIDKSFGPK